MLTLISTPIGNLGDVSKGTIVEFETCDYVLAEDTRVTRNLLCALNLNIRLVSFNKNNEREKEDEVIKDVAERV